MILALSVAAIAAVVWTATVGWGGTANPADVTLFTVAPRSFNVVLKEKGELKASKSTDIKCEVEGRSTIITIIPEGAAVKEGDLLVELASDQIVERIRQEELKEANARTAYESAKTELEIQLDRNLSDIRKADLQIELNQLALDRYQKGDWEQQLKDAHIAIDQAKTNLLRREEDFQASKSLREKNYVTKTQYDEDEFAKLKAEWELQKAEKALEVLKEYTHVAELRQRESNLDEAGKEYERVKKNAAAEENKKRRAVEGAEKELNLITDQLAKLRRQKDKCRIIAPTQGFVVYGGGGGGGRFFMSSDEQIKEGAEVFERQVLMQLPDTTEMMVVVRVHEAKTDKLALGQLATVEVEGVPGKRFTGKVTKIAVIADSQNRWLNPDLKEYETEITLDATDVPLKPGVTAHVEIMVGGVEDRLAVPVQAIFSKGGKRYAFRRSGKSVEPVGIKLGAVSTEWAEISEGLTQGDRIQLDFGEDLKRMIPDAPAADRGPGMAQGRRPVEAGAAKPEAKTESKPAAAPSERPDRRPRRDAGSGGAPGGRPMQRSGS
jgi:HlyD family secretion protein